MIETMRVQSIPEVLDRLRAAPTDRRYLSVHLDTSPERTLGQAYATWLKEALRQLRDELGDVGRVEHERFERAASAAERFVADQVAPEPAGLAVYADGTGEFELAVPLPMSPLNLVIWQDYPAIEPLVEALDEQERVAVLLIDKERTRFFTVFLGQIEERTIFADDVPGKQATGDWFGLSQKRYERHHDDMVLRHIKRTTRAMVDELRKRPFDRLFVSGSPEAVSVLTHHLPRPLQDRFAGTFELEMFASDADVLEAALKEAEKAERNAELDAVRDILDASTAQNASVGLDATLAVLHDARVHRLLVARDLDVAGGECPACGRLTLQTGSCPACGAALNPISSIRERAVASALAQGARVDIVAGDAADLLMSNGGMAAWTRY